ncbi:hypothetical protein HNP46_000062 [Pseudomonas nitritireducens]|uniref:Uncharacterized protein n=1 Tax=Pseudomonas nitroreducens TaxID=46680 RepID=A0A7W7KE98_PSENT|nr:hypothetical protein [Pseudomonas nitritireducens]MBB4861251.1 hypothetical protein [Pseudomonas nitritireducens]
MVSRIGQALKNCLTNEVAHAKAITEHDASTGNNFAYRLLPASVVGASLMKLYLSASQPGNSVTENVLAAGQMVVDATAGFANDHSTGLMVGGAVVATAFAATFVKGLALENEELRKRLRDAFQKEGYGEEAVRSAERAHAALLKTHSDLNSLVHAETQSLKALLLKPSKELVKIAKKHKVDIVDPEAQRDLQMAYIHGLRQALAEGVAKGRDMSGSVKIHSRDVKAAILAGMTTYYQAIVGSEPSLGAKVKYTITGREGDLIQDSVAGQKAQKGYDAIRAMDADAPKGEYSKKEILEALQKRERDSSVDLGR